MVTGRLSCPVTLGLLSSAFGSDSEPAIGHGGSSTPITGGGQGVEREREQRNWAVFAQGRGEECLDPEDFHETEALTRLLWSGLLGSVWC